MLFVESPYSGRVDTEESLSGGSALPLVVRTGGSERSLPAGPSYLIGRDPKCDIVITDGRVSWRHAVLRLENGRWLLVDRASTNGTYAAGHRVDRIEIDGECLVRLGHPADGPTLSCFVAEAEPRATAMGGLAGWRAGRGTSEAQDAAHRPRAG